MLLTKTVDSIMSTFNKAIADLESLASKQETRAAAHEDTVQHHVDCAECCRDEANRAKAIATKLKAIVN